MNAKPVSGFPRSQAVRARYAKTPVRPGLHIPGARKLSTEPSAPLVETRPSSVLLRREIGEVLRSLRQRQGRTLREVSAAARVSLGYLSEVERGQKEASSELLASICEALNVPLWVVLREVSDRIAVAEGVRIPDTVPAELAASLAMSGCTAG